MKKYQITVNGQKYFVEVESLDEDDSLKMQNHGYHPNYLREKAHSEHTWDNIHPSVPKKNVNAEHGVLNSPVNGTVLEIKVNPGMQTNPSEIAFVVEAMKMKTNIYPGSVGVIKSVDVKLGDRVEQGQKLLTYEA